MVVGEQVVEAVLVPILRSLGSFRRALRLVRQLPVLVFARDPRLVVVDLGHLPTPASIENTQTIHENVNIYVILEVSVLLCYTIFGTNYLIAPKFISGQ